MLIYDNLVAIFMNNSVFPFFVSCHMFRHIPYVESERFVKLGYFVIF
jgi:hypothetical protein